MKNFSDRLAFMIADTGQTHDQFAITTNIAASSIRNLLNGSKPQGITLNKIIAALPDYNPKWITLGIGPIHDGDPEPIGANKVAQVERDDVSFNAQIFEFLKAQINQKDSEIQRLLNIMERQSQSLAKYKVRPLGAMEMSLSRGELVIGGRTNAA